MHPGLPIKFSDVYKDLTFVGLPEAEVLKKYPELEREDIAAVWEYAVHLIKSRTHGEYTGRPILPKDQLRDGGTESLHRRECGGARGGRMVQTVRTSPMF